MSTVILERPSEERKAASERFHALDFLRAFAMLLGVFLHAAVPYMRTDAEFWPASDAYKNIGYDLGVFVIHAFRMELFFLMAGFFAHLLYQRGGPVPFIKHRGLRIGVPFVAGWALMTILLPLSVGERPYSKLFFILPAHLWFLYFLLAYYAIITLLGLTAGRKPHERFWAAADRVTASIIRSPLQSLLLAVATLPLLVLMETPVVDTPLEFYPQPKLLAYYGIFVALGWVLHRRTELLQSITRWRWVSLGAAVLLTLPLLVLLDGLPLGEGNTVDRFSGAVLAVRCLYAVYTWLLIFAVMGLFMRHFHWHSDAARYLADSAYWQYIMHLPLVFFLQVQFVDAPIPGPLKLPLILLITVGVLLLTYHFFVRYTIIGRVLNGPRWRGDSPR